MNKLTTFLIIIILVLLVYLALKPSGNNSVDLLKAQFTELQQKIDLQKKDIMLKLDSLKMIEKKETIIRNYYNEIVNANDSITSDVSAIREIRKWLDTLSTVR